MRAGEREEVRKRLLEIALRATQLAELTKQPGTSLVKVVEEVRRLRDEIAMLETALRAARGPDDETMI